MRAYGRILTPAPRTSVAVALFCAAAVLAALGLRPARADALALSLSMPASVTVGQANITAHLIITNTAGVTATVCENGNCAGPAADLVPSCGAVGGVGLTCVSPDAGVFAFAAVARVPLGSQCGDNPLITEFDVTVADPATGGLRLSPRGSLVTLGPGGSATANCDVRLTFDVARTPSIDAAPGSPDTQTKQIAYAQAYTSGPMETAYTTNVTTVLASAGSTSSPPPPPPPPPPGSCVDCDRDTFPASLDCDDTDAAIRPGTREVVGNKVDENCDGIAEPYPRLDAAITYAFTRFGSRTRFTELYVRPARAGSAIRVTCRGGGCPFKTKTRAVKRTVRRLDISASVRHARLRPGARLEVRVTRAATIGVIRRLTVRARKRPTQVDLCLVPGAKGPSPCLL